MKVKVYCQWKKDYIELCRPVIESCYGSEVKQKYHKQWKQWFADKVEKPLGAALGQTDYELPEECGIFESAGSNAIGTKCHHLVILVALIGLKKF